MQQLGKLPYNRSSPEMKTTLKMWQKFLFFSRQQAQETVLPNNSIGEFCFLFSKQCG